MAVVGTYPGVYVRELSSGVRTIVGVGTSIGMFIGRAKQGELKKPMRCLSFADFERTFSAEYAKSDLAREVRLFFDNGGTDCYVVRIADGAVAASLMLKDEAKGDTLLVTAKSAGLAGNDIRVGVSYNTTTPEGTFNLEVFRWVKQSNGVLQVAQREFYPGLSMDKDHPRYCEDLVNLTSQLVTVADQRKSVPLAGNGVSISGFPISSRINATFQTQVDNILKGGGPNDRHTNFRISIGGRPPKDIDLSGLINNVPATPAALETQMVALINPQLPAGASVLVKFPVSGMTGPAGANNLVTRVMTIEGVNEDVYIEPASTSDLARVLMLGTAQGGIEIPRAGARRPAPNGVVFRSTFSAWPNAYSNFGDVLQYTAPPPPNVPNVNAVRIGGSTVIPLTGALALQTSPQALTPHMYQDSTATTADDGRDGIREKFALVAAAINNEAAANANFKWAAQVWGSRIAVLGTGDLGDLATTTLEAGFIPPPPPSPPPFNVVANVFETATQPMTQNVRYYPLGVQVAGNYYGIGVPASDGTWPKAQQYQEAYQVIDREVDLFNLLVLPHDEEHTNSVTRSLWGPASTFCEQKRAFLLIDPPADWVDHNSATSTSVGVNTLRVGLSKQYSAVYFPNVVVREGEKEIPVGPSGAVAGVMARIDSTRGVWKAAAGVEADLRGVVALQRRFSDDENGVMNPRAVNTVRVFPNGIVVWGARTMDGDDGFGSEYKYSPIRRLANMIEESLYRGLKWAVFEPNDEPLWAQIRLNVGAFMHSLFRQGAFQGATARDAYFVRCDGTTTTQNDINLGIVNIIVGFAPLKPAEFVVLYLKQIAGQIQT